MSFSNYLRCCFPKNKEEAVGKGDEDYDVKYTSGEKKSELKKNSFKEESPEQIGKSKGIYLDNGNSISLQLNLNSKDLSSNSIYDDKKMNLGGDNSFASFGGKKSDTTPGNANNQGQNSNQIEMSKNILKDVGKGEESAGNTGTSLNNQNNHNNHNNHTNMNVNVNVNNNLNNMNINLNNLNNNANPSPINISNGNLIDINQKQQRSSIVGNGQVTVPGVLHKRTNDDSNIDFMNSQRQITDEEIKNAPCLILEEILGEMLRNNKLKINAAGLTTGLRKQRDGVAFFGKNTDAVVNDFDLSLEPNAEYGPHVFIIYFRRDTGKFYLKCYKDKQFKGQIYIKLDSVSDFQITKKEIVLLSETYFQVNPLHNGKLEVQNLGTNNKESDGPVKYTFDTSEYQTVTIGRDVKCSLSYPGDKSFSKIQASFSYDAEKKVWRLKDGTADKPSTNGSWIYATHSYEVTDTTVFQFGSSRLKINLNC